MRFLASLLIALSTQAGAEGWAPSKTEALEFCQTLADPLQRAQVVREHALFNPLTDSSVDVETDINHDGITELLTYHQYRNGAEVSIENIVDREPAEYWEGDKSINHVDQVVDAGRYRFVLVYYDRTQIDLRHVAIVSPDNTYSVLCDFARVKRPIVNAGDLQCYSLIDDVPSGRYSFRRSNDPQLRPEGIYPQRPSPERYQQGTFTALQSLSADVFNNGQPLNLIEMVRTGEERNFGGFFEPTCLVRFYDLAEGAVPGADVAAIRLRLFDLQKIDIPPEQIDDRCSGLDGRRSIITHDGVTYVTVNERSEPDAPGYRRIRSRRIQVFRGGTEANTELCRGFIVWDLVVDRTWLDWLPD